MPSLCAQKPSGLALLHVTTVALHLPSERAVQLVLLVKLSASLLWASWGECVRMPGKITSKAPSGG